VASQLQKLGIITSDVVKAARVLDGITDSGIRISAYQQADSETVQDLMDTGIKKNARVQEGSQAIAHKQSPIGREQPGVHNTSMMESSDEEEPLPAQVGVDNPDWHTELTKAKGGAKCKKIKADIF